MWSFEDYRLELRTAQMASAPMIGGQSTPIAAARILSGTVPGTVLPASSPSQHHRSSQFLPFAKNMVPGPRRNQRGQSPERRLRNGSPALRSPEPPLTKGSVLFRQDREALTDASSTPYRAHGAALAGATSPSLVASVPVLPASPMTPGVATPIIPRQSSQQGAGVDRLARSDAHASAPQAQAEDFEKTLFSMDFELKSVPHRALGRSPNDVSSMVQVVSLGSSCGVKMTLRRLGLDEATMPLDWIRTRSSAIVHWLRSGFVDFFRVPFHRIEINFRDSPMTVYRSHTHSFWHDDIEDLGTRQKLWRRIQRFLSLSNESTRKLLFVRTAATSTELEDSETLYRLLEQHFAKAGREVWLLIICEDQQMNGPIRHQTHERLIHWMQPSIQGKLSTTREGTGPYEEPIGFALRLILNDPACFQAWGQCPRVSRCSEICCQGSPLLNLGCKPCEAGIWAGKVTKKGETQSILFCAFEGHSDREVPWIWG